MKHITGFNRYKLYENFKTYNVDGLDEFINQLIIKHVNVPDGVFAELRAFIERSGCPKIKFEPIPRALGISKTDECIVDSSVINSPIQRVLYVILHEVAHQYQYKKHGKNLALKIYQNNIDIDEAATALLNIEQTADRLAIKKATEILNGNGIPIPTPISGYYLNKKSTTGMDTYIKDIRNEVKSKGYTTIEEINDYIYNKVKQAYVKPNPTYSTSNKPAKVIIKNEDEVNRILDKIGDEGYNSLTTEERNTLRDSVG